MSSKRSQILERLKETVLPAITAAAGYNLTVKIVERGWRIPSSMGKNEFPAIFIATTSESRKNETMGTPRNYDAKLQVAIVGYVMNTKPNPKADGSGVQLDLDKLIEDITHALYDDITQNGLCTFTDVVGVETDDGDLLPVAGCKMAVTFGYFEEGNPS